MSRFPSTPLRRTLRAAVLLACACATCGRAAQNLAAAETPQSAAVRTPQTAAWIGANYTPAYAANQVQFWHEFKPEIVEKELAAARRRFGITSLRVYLHYLNYREEKEVFLANLEKFLTLCDKAGIKPGFTFFDDCWNHQGITLQTPPPVPGRHNGRWAAVQDVDRKDVNLALFESYVTDIVKKYAADPRVLWWEVYNEPNRNDRFTELLCQKGFTWVKAQKPTQPVLCCWDDNPQTDIVNAHNYTDEFAAGGSWDRQADLRPAKGAVFTEAGARWYAGKPASNGSPTEVIAWLRYRKAEKKYVPGVYLCWELMAGNSHCRWYWGTPDGAAEPPVPWCGLLFPDCTPVSYAEAEAVRAYATGQSQALLFEDFQDVATAPASDPAGWQRLGSRAEGRGSRWCTLAGHEKLVAGQETWKDYLVEAAVMLQDPVNQGNAGICFRASRPGPGLDEITGYYAGFSGSRLYLGRMENNWQELASVDLAGQPAKVTAGAWNRLRVAVRGDRIRVWLNPTVGHTEPLLDVRDKQTPIPQGKIALRTANITAGFDDVVVLPIEVLEGEK